MKITIVTIVRNDINNIEKTLNSCIAQVNINKEYIVINGNSNDGTNEIINKHIKQIDKYVNEPDSGIYDAMNKGIRLATGDWIIFMNSGDVFYDNITLFNIYKNNIGHNTVIAGLWLESNNLNKVNLPNVSFKYGMIGCHQAILVKTEYLKKHYFNTKYIISADFDFFSKFRSDPFFYLYIYNKPISIINPDGLGRNKKLYLKEYLEIIYENYGLFSYLKYKLHHTISKWY